MIIVRNERLIKRNNRLGVFSGILSIVILGIGMYVSFRYQEQVIYSAAALAGGLIFSQISMSLSTRFGRSPRPDQALDSSLKGLDDHYALYHYQSPVSHLLVGPAGLWILMPFPQKGKIYYQEQKGRWKKQGGSFYGRLLGQDNLGRPEKDISSGMARLRKRFETIPDLDLPEIQAALVFTDEGATVEAEGAPHPTVHALQLKKLIRKEAKGQDSLPRPAYKAIQDFLGLESIA